jgi:MFS family permease
VPTGGGPASTIAAGVLAAACLGEIAPVSHAVRDAFGLSPPLLGATISLITLIAAAVAAPAGLWLRHRDPRPWLAVGLAVMAGTGGLMTAVAPSQAALLGLRAAQGTGYLLVVVGGPVALVRQLAPDRGPVGLALWGGCTPAGLAVSAAVGGVADTAQWRSWLAALAIACAAAAAAVLATARRPEPGAPAPAPGRAGRHLRLAGPVRLAGGFGLMSLLAVATVSVLPTYLTGRLNLSPAAAGAATSVVAAASIPGNAVAAVLLRRGVRPALLAGSMLACPVLAFAAFAGTLAWPGTVGAGAALVFAVGLAASAAYASLPAVAPAAESLPLANGILVQVGSAGGLVGPPLFAAVTGLRHWELIGYLAIPVAIGSAAAMASATLASRPRLLA